ncbi:MAG: AAA family ATPase [Oligoflexales bacterium]
MEISSDLEQAVQESAVCAEQILKELSKRIIGQEHVGRRLLMAMMCQGHVLLEGLPGLAKTSSITALAEVLDLAFKRVQFTPDLLPADVVGSQIYNPQESKFLTRKGPIFTNLLLADEVNRAPAKVQSALLEAMAEKQVTIGEESFKLSVPFLVMATQNPIEQEGTYTLPEAQLDRFLFKVEVDYTSLADEIRIVEQANSGKKITLERVASIEQIQKLSDLQSRIHIADAVREYIVKLVFATRFPEQYHVSELKSRVSCGASPRASIYLEMASRAQAILEGRSFVTPQDVKNVAQDVLRHRIKMSFEAEAEEFSPVDAIDLILRRVEVP